MSIRFALLAALILALVAAGTAQDVIHYKFDAGGGKKVINYAGASGIAPREGKISHRSSYPNARLWIPGRFGHALMGDPLGQEPQVRLDTGWSGAINGSFTVAFFLKSRTPIPSSSAVSFVRTTNNSEGLTAGVSGVDGKLTFNWKSAGSQIRTTADVYKLSLHGWVHVALVVDATILYATYYVNGSPEIPMRCSNAILPPSSLNTRIGTFSAYGSFDVDEFRVRFGTATAAEIKAWATQNPAADGAYGQGCWPKGRPVLLDSNSDRHGPPAVGNNHYAIELYGLPGSTFVLGLGTNRLSLGATPLPLDLGFVDPVLKGCNWESSGDVAWLHGAIPPAGRVNLPFPVPAISALIGITLYSQAVLYSPVLKRYMATNAFAAAIGQ
jgi:hypothetical protein